MNKQIPMYFDSVVVSSPFKEISETNPNVGRLQVRVFTKYGNRNGSYITDAVADQLIQSATNGSTPVIGFFDPATESWASHSGPTLANGYGYVEKFVGWEPFEDTDGVTREYAVFSVILFTKYFEEAKKIAGQNQSMELDPASITGDWTMINNEEYYVYTHAEMLGFCVIGEHEPRFSVSAFFSKNDNNYQSQHEKFASLLSDLKSQVEEAEKSNKGGEQAMDFENTNVVEETVVEETQVQEGQAPEEFQETSVTEVETPAEPEVTETFESESESEPAAEEPASEPEPETETEFTSEEKPTTEESIEPSEFDVLQQQFNELQEKYNNVLETIEQLKAANEGSVQTIMSLRADNEKLQTSLASYEKLANDAEAARKEELVEKYEKVVSSEEIKPIREKMNDFSYDELESKLAIIYANKQFALKSEQKVPVPEAPESQFALLMRKYRK